MLFGYGNRNAERLVGRANRTILSGVLPSVYRVVKNRYSHAADEEGGDFASHQRNGQALKDRIGENDTRANDNSEGSEEHGAETNGTRIHDRFRQGHAFAEALFNEVDEDN